MSAQPTGIRRAHLTPAFLTGGYAVGVMATPGSGSTMMTGLPVGLYSFAFRGRAFCAAADSPGRAGYFLLDSGQRCL
jgi:hypothetical protein